MKIEICTVGYDDSFIDQKITIDTDDVYNLVAKKDSNKFYFYLIKDKGLIEFDCNRYCPFPTYISINSEDFYEYEKARQYLISLVTG